MEKDTDQKQKVIKEEIDDKGHDHKDFMTFLSKKKKGGDDLKNWKIEEIKAAITEYQSSHLKKEEKTDKNKKQPEDIQSEIERLKVSDAGIDEKVPKTVEIKCKKLEKSKLNDKEIVVKIQNPQSVESGFLSSNYVYYEVETALFKWLVKRRYSDFEWLRLTLGKYHPGYVLPPLPSKKMGSRRFEDDFIHKRMHFLQKFIDAVVANEVFKATEPLTAFLSMVDRNQFEAKMKEISSLQHSPFIEESKTFNGNLFISPEEDTNNLYFENVASYFRIQTKLYQSLNGNIKRFYNSINAAGKCLEGVQKDFETLTLLNTKVMMKDQITKSFEELGEFIKNWRRILLNQNEMVKSHLKDFFKLMRMEGTSYAELVKRREEVKTKYVDENCKLTTKKEKLWAQLDVTKWEIVDEFGKVDREMLTKDKAYAQSKMCTRETVVVENWQKQLSYYNRMCIEGLKELVKNNCKKFMDNMKEFSDEFYPSLTDCLTVFSSLSMFVASYSM